jgi:hypothetical protein
MNAAGLAEPITQYHRRRFNVSSCFYWLDSKNKRSLRAGVILLDGNGDSVGAVPGTG